jgi:hypothetical protein
MIAGKYTSDQFALLIQEASNRATTDWEEKFLDDMTDRLVKYGPRLMVTDKQLSKLERMAEGSDDVPQEG